MKMNRIKTGWYASEDGHFAVIKDMTGYVTQEERDGDGVLAGCADDGWMLAYDEDGHLRDNDSAGETLNWFDTKKQAVAAAEHEYRCRGYNWKDSL